MTTSRREFLQVTAAAGGALGLGMLGEVHAQEREVPKAEKPLRILILGGTGFTGPHQIHYALARGHEVTIFNRGRTEPTVHRELVAQVEQLTGDRDDNIEALRGREWDAVIDNSASIPRWVRQSAGLLKDSVELYLFTSSLSVHADNSKIGITEDDPVATIDDPTVEEITGETYGALKALCEQEARDAFPDRAIIVRPHLIVGPGDRSDRWTYWPVRVERGGEVMAPGEPTDPTQYIDSRDLAEFDIHLIEQRAVGTYSAVGPLAPLSMAELLFGMRAVVSNEICFTWVDADFLAEHEVAPWAHMPAWIPPRDGFQGFSAFDNSRAVGAGLEYRPLAVTAKDTLDWWKTLPEERRASPGAGLDAEREREVLAAWHGREGGNR
ncbi:MAG: NAD-dependent epimerase/dehydratase family protein [Gemmatimonadota bacterium]|nr:MAG: NAD-dependent epimerase/dehydratase family protein [Gemmatimonadota bacterium]